jgi:hypothetical protein
MSINFIFSDNIEPGFRGNFINYDKNLISNPSANQIDLNNFLTEYQDEWLTEYDHWFSEYARVSTKIIPFWDFSIGSRTTIWYPYELESLIFSMGVIKVIKERNLNEILILNAPQRATEYLRNYETHTQLSFLDFKRVFSSLKININSILNSFKIFLKTDKVNINTKEPTDLIVFSFFLGINNRTPADHFFGSYFDNKDIKSKYLYYYLNSNLKNETRFLNENNRDAIFVYQLINFSDFIISVFKNIRFWLSSIYVYFCFKDELVCSGVIFPYYFKTFFFETVLNNSPINEFITFQATNKAIRKFNPKAILLPFEEKGTEHAVIKAANNANKEVVTIGFAHANYNNGHRYIYFNKSFLPRYPKFIATTGDIQKKWLIDFCNWPAEKLIFMGSPRSTINLEMNIQKHSENIIFLVGYLHELIQFANIIISEPTIFEGFNLIIRPYPYDKIVEQMQQVDLIRSFGIIVDVDLNAELSMQLQNSSIAIFSSSSAGFEAVANNCLLINMNLNNIINTNPLIGKTYDDEIKICNSNAELLKTLHYFRNLDLNSKIEIIEKQKNFIKNIYSKMDLSELKFILN